MTGILATVRYVGPRRAVTDSTMTRRHRIGAHTSAAGGVDRAAAEAAKIGCNALQVFTRSPRIWKGKRPAKGSIERLAELRHRHDLQPVAVHGSYLTNLASADPVVRARSQESFRLEISNARAIGADYLVIHPGSAAGQDRETAIKGFALALADAQEGFKWGPMRLLLENTAGAGATLGRTFEELAEIRDAAVTLCRVPVGYCIDTAHSLAAGYDVASEQGLEDTLGAIRDQLGLDRVHLIHANDSKAPLGSNRDRHESIGEGHIGSDAFRRMLRHPQLRDKPFILETPLIENSHRENVRRMWDLAGGAPRI